MNKWNQHCKNGHITKCNLSIQHSPYQNNNEFLHRNRKIYSEIRIEIQKTLTRQSNSEQKGKAEGITMRDFEYTKEPYNKNSMVLTQKQAGKPLD
jgi:hypothetical protein